jgi:hypothetical protein
VERVLPHATIKDRMAALAVGLAVDWYEGDPAILELCTKNLPEPLNAPMVAFLTSDGTFVDGFAGWIEPPDFVKVLARAEASPLLLASPAVRKQLEKPAAAATAAAAKGERKAVLAAARDARRTTGRCAERKAIADAEQQARAWAEAQLAGVAQQAAAGGDLAPLRKQLAAVKQQFAGEPEAADADTGTKALQRLQVVREVEAAPNPARDLRERSAAPFRGTRWEAIFAKPAK